MSEPKKKSPILKLLLGLVIFVVIVIVAFVILFGLFGDKAIRIGVEKGATSALGVDVTLEDVSLSVLNGKLNLNELVVKNPQGYKHDNLLSLGHAYVALNTASLMSDTIEIDTLKLEQMEITVEQKDLTTSNLKEVLDNLPTSDKPETPADEEKPGKNLLIKELELNGIVVNTAPLPGVGTAGTITLKLAPIKMSNLGGENKIDIAKLSAIILKSITEGILKEGMDMLPTDMLGNISEGLGEQGKELLKTGEDMLKEGGDIGKDIIKQGEDIGEEAKGLIEGLFKKKDDK